MWELGHKESWAPNKWCFSTVVLEKTLENPLRLKEIKLVNPKGNQSWIFIGRTDAEAEAPQEEPTHWKRPDAGKDWRQKEKRAAEDEMAVWHHWFNRHKLGHALGDGEGQGSLVCCSLWGREKSDMTWQLNNSYDSGRHKRSHSCNYFWNEWDRCTLLFGRMASVTMY